MRCGSVLAFGAALVIAITNIELGAAFQVDLGRTPDYGSCVAENRTTIAPEYRYDALLQHPIPTSGRLPARALNPDGQGTEYNVISGENGIRSVELDGIAWVANGETTSLIGDVAPVPYPMLVEIIGFVQQFSDCGSQPSTLQMASFMTDFGMGWSCGPGDVFHTEESPLTAACGGSLSRTRGAVPLELYEARLLFDGRTALIIGEASNHDSEGHLISGRRVASLWIIDKTDQGWKIDAAIGGLLTPESVWLSV